MFFEWITPLKLIRIHFNDQEHLDWECNTWNKSNIKNQVVYYDKLEDLVSADIFKTINNYLATVPKDVLSKIESLYKEIYEHFEDIGYFTLTEFNAKLNILIYELLKLIIWDEFHEWCITKGNLNLNIGIKEHLNDNDTIEQTYFTKDYNNILVFSVLLKLIMPIWGMYERSLKKELDSDYTFIQAVDLIRNEYIETNPAFIKLTIHVANYARTKIKNKGFSITNDIGTEEVPEYLLALILWKKVCTFDGRTMDKSIIRDIYHVLMNTCDSLSAKGPAQKKPYPDKMEELSIVETFKITQRLPPANEVMATEYVHMENIIMHIEPAIIPWEVMELQNNINPNIKAIDIHVAIIALISKNQIGIRTIELLDRKTSIRLICLASKVLYHWQFFTLAELLITVPGIKDIHTINFSSNKAQLNINAEIIRVLNYIYRYTSQNEGLKLIYHLCDCLNNYTWELQSGKFEEVAIELANLIIKINKEDIIIENF